MTQNIARTRLGILFVATVVSFVASQFSWPPFGGIAALDCSMIFACATIAVLVYTKSPGLQRLIKRASILAASTGAAIPTTCLLIPAAYLAIITGNAYLNGEFKPDMFIVRPLVDFHGQTPFQYRVLPLVFMHVMTHSGVSLWRSMQVVADVSFLAVVVGFYLILRQFIPHRHAVLLSPVILFALWWDHTQIGNWSAGFNQSAIYYPADIPSIAFLLWGIWAILRKNDELFIFLFPAATLTRETSAYLILAFALINGLTRDTVIHTLYLGLCWVAIKLDLDVIFVQSPGLGLFVWKYHENIALVSGMWHHAPGTAIAINQFELLFYHLWLLVPIGWKSRPTALKALLWIVPVEFAVMFAVGMIEEMRIYDDALVVIALNACVAVSQGVANRR
jgi:hypothetical protein